MMKFAGEWDLHAKPERWRKLRKLDLRGSGTQDVPTVFDLEELNAEADAALIRDILKGKTYAVPLFESSEVDNGRPIERPSVYKQPPVWQGRIDKPPAWRLEAKRRAIELRERKKSRTVLLKHWEAVDRNWRKKHNLWRKRKPKPKDKRTRWIEKHRNMLNKDMRRFVHAAVRSGTFSLEQAIGMALASIVK